MTNEQALTNLAQTLEVISGTLERIATALEQNVLDRIDHAPNATFADPYPSDLPFPTDEVVELPPITAPVSNTLSTPSDQCPIHHAPWKTIPAGVSKRTGNAYAAFRACSVAGCDQRPKL